MKSRKIPQRTCVGCRATRDKRELLRIVRTPEGVVELDQTGRKNGRGAYVCPDMNCLQDALSKKRLARALKCTITDEDIARLEREFEAVL